MLNYAVLAVVVYAGLCLLLFLFQRSMMYFPHPPSAVRGTDSITLPVGEAKVLVTTRAHAGPNALLYFGGNAEDVSYNLPDLSGTFPDFAIYLMHYRGYGGSSGNPSEAALFADAVALFDRVAGEHRNIVAVGRSLGSGVALHLASVRPVSRLVLVTPYDSIQDVASRHYPFFPVRWLLLDKYESWRYAADITVPTLLIAAESDEVIPRASTEALATRFRHGVASLRILAGTGHNSISASPEYLPLLKGPP